MKSPNYIPKIAYVECRDGLPLNTDSMAAAEGLEWLGCQIKMFQRIDIQTDKYRNLYRSALFVGSADTLSLLWEKAIGQVPEPLDYPEMLRTDLFLGRQIHLATVRETVVQFQQQQQPVFVKSVQSKRFTGLLLNRDQQVAYFDEHLDAQAWVSTPIRFMSEWRGFVYGGELVDCRPYSGDFRLAPDYSFMELAIKIYQPAPVAYTLDVGITDGGQTYLVEVNDCWAIGAYGLAPDTYASLLIDRYFQLMAD